MSRSLQRFGCNSQFSCTHTALLELAVVGRSSQTQEHCSTHGHAEGRSLPRLCLSPLRQDGSGMWLIPWGLRHWVLSERGCRVPAGP